MTGRRSSIKRKLEKTSSLPSLSQGNQSPKTPAGASPEPRRPSGGQATSGSGLDRRAKKKTLKSQNSVDTLRERLYFQKYEHLEGSTKINQATPAGPRQEAFQISATNPTG